MAATAHATSGRGRHGGATGTFVHATARRYSVTFAVTTHVPVDPDAELLARLRRGDERAFRTLVERHSATMLRVARLHVRDRQAAEEVVQETWLAVIKGLERFEGRSTLKTWLFRILTNRAKTRGEREARSVPFSAVAAADASGDDPAVSADRFQGPDDPYPRHWAAPPATLGDPSRRTAALAGDAQADRRSDRAAASRATRRHPAPRHRGVGGGRGLRGARALRRQPARAPAPRALEGARRTRTLPWRRGDDRVRFSLRRTPRDVACIEFVELVTDYLEGALPASRATGVRAPPHALRQLHLVPRADARDAAPHGRAPCRRRAGRGCRGTDGRVPGLSG